MPDEYSPQEATGKLPVLSERLAQLEAHGVVSRARCKPRDEGAFTIGPREAGAFQRFLEDRD
jgi:hypothetical protein